MKTHCKPKHVNIESEHFNSPAVHKAFAHGKLAKNEFARLLVRTGEITRREVEIEYLTQDYHKIPVAIEKLNATLTEGIRQRNLDLQPIRQFQRPDGISQKMRTLSKLSPKQQVYEYIAVEALMPLFRAKLLPYQYGSIPGKGQTNGKRRIERILRQKFHGKLDEVKCDVRHAYESVTVECVMRLLHRDIRKNKVLLWFVGACMENYPNGALVIGGYLPTWLFNYVMAYVLRYIMDLEKSRRGKPQKLIAACVCYADDFSLYGRISNLKRAVKRASQWCKEVLGLEIKSLWSISYISSFEDEKAVHKLRKAGAHIRTQGIDMMGYVVYRTYTIIRGKIFVRIRRQFIRAKRALEKLKYVPHWIAYKIMAYFGWLKHSNSSKFKRAYDVYKILRKAKQSISRHSKARNKAKEVYIHERILHAAA